MAKQENININKTLLKIDIRPVRRAMRDIGDWRLALESAERAITPRRVELYDLYSEIILDAHLKAVLSKRKLNILNKPLIYKINDNTDNAINELCQTPEFTKLLNYILDSLFWGHSLIYINPTRQGLSFELINRKNVVPEKSIIIANQYDIAPLINYTDTAAQPYFLEVGEKKTLGLLLEACPIVLYKRGSFGDWAQFAERFGMPMIVGKYDGFDEETRLKLNDAFNNIGSAASVTIPNEANVELFEANNASGNSDLFRSFIDVCNKELSVLVLGQTMTTEDGSSLSQSQVHKEVEETISKADEQFLLSILNYKLKPLLELHGYPIADGKFDLDEQKGMSIMDRIQVDSVLSTIVPIDDDYWYDTYCLPKPPNYNQLKQIQQQQIQQATQQPAEDDEMLENYLHKRSAPGALKWLRNFFASAPHSRGK